MTTPPPPGTVVVGIDGSPCSDLALDWAAAQAALEHRHLTVVYSAHLGSSADTLAWGQPGIDVAALIEEVKVVGRGLLDNARRRAHRHAPELVVHQIVATVDARRALLDLAEEAAVVVVGSRGRGPIASLLLGSVSVALTRHAACPVVVVRHDPLRTPYGGILVDVDGTTDSLPAIELAYRMASLRGLTLTAQHVFFDPSHPRPEECLVADDEAGYDDMRAVLSESVAGMREKFPEVTEHLVLRRGFSDHEVIAASQDVQLVVVASRRHGFVDGLLRGSIAPTVVEHAACDVVVVPCGDPTR